MNGETFRAWTEQFLASVLRPGDIIIRDNLPSHKVAGIREAIELHGALLHYSRPHSPDIIRIEQVFAKHKAAFAKSRRTHRRKTLERNIQNHQSLLAPRMRRLHQSLRLCQLSGIRSSKLPQTSR